MLLAFTVLLVAAPPIPTVVQQFLKRERLTIDQTCAAVKRLRLIKFDLPKCELGDEVVETRGNECNKHYTLFEGSKGAVCQCNKNGEHSETIVLDEGEYNMNNLKFPCLKLCYPRMIKHLISHSTRIIRLTYKRVDSDAADDLHEALLKGCDDWVKD